MKTKKPRYNLSIMRLLVIPLLLIQTGLLVTLWMDSRLIKKDTFSAVADQRSGNYVDPFEVQPIADAPNKRLYLPGLGLYLPLTLEAQDLTYRVTDTSGGDTIDLVFMSNFNNRFAGSQKAIECRDLLRIEIGANESKPRNGETPQTAFTLNDGRMIYTYLPFNISECQDGLPVTPQQVETLSRQLRSY